MTIAKCKMGDNGSSGAARLGAAITDPIGVIEKETGVIRPRNTEGAIAPVRTAKL